MHRSLRRALLCLVGLGLLSACVAGPAPRDRFYRLNVATPEGSGPRLPGSLVVERFTSDDVLRERGMLRVESGGAEVAPYVYHLWVESPTLLLQRALADYLRAAAVADSVMTPDAGATEDWHVNGHLRRFDQLLAPSPRVRVELELRLRRRGGETLVSQKVYAAESPADAADPEAAARAFSAAVEQIFARFAADLHATAASL